jgi:positive regulator of sigma E activity
VDAVRRQVAIRIASAALLVAAGIVFLRPIVNLLTGVSMFVVSVFFFPALFVVLGWFLFSVWGKVYFRAWHIRRIRNARDLREAVERGRSGA